MQGTEETEGKVTDVRTETAYKAGRRDEISKSDEVFAAAGILRLRRKKDVTEAHQDTQELPVKTVKAAAGLRHLSGSRHRGLPFR